jgi:uncharacterized protein (DUF2147 family)
VSLKSCFPLAALMLAISLLAPAVGNTASFPTADAASPIGKWKTVDDATGRVNSKVLLWVDNGKLYGKIEELISPDPRDLAPRCLRCKGVLKDRPVIGLQILWDLRKTGNEWSGGQILDPDSGKVYHCSITVIEGGRKLKVRGFIGFSLLGRTEYWLRDD